MVSRGKVLIVGGGIAGIKAALELKAHGIEYLILEAKDRLGGRMKTVEGVNTKYDVGASWFHDTLSNPLFDEENGLPDGKGVKWHYDDMPYKFYDKDGEVPDESRLVPISEEITSFIEMESQNDLFKDTSVYESISDYFKQKKKFLTKKQIEHAYGFKRHLELWHGIDIGRMSAKYCDAGHNGRNALSLHYDTVLKRHTDQLDEGSYELNKPIKLIERTDKNRKVKITAVDGKEYTGDYAIVTIPYSMYELDENEKGAIKFEPKLPDRLRETFSKTHFGALGKVILEFDEEFWGTKTERMLCLASPPEGYIDSILNDKPTPELLDPKSPKTWEYPILFLNFATSLKIPSLVCLTQSPLTDYLESNPDKAWEYLKPMVQVISGKKDIPTPKNVFTSEWTTNVYQRGSYTACFPEDDPISSILAFQEGFGNIRFAGEHTILDGCGCVHGAWASGLREAQYIIEKLT